MTDEFFNSQPEFLRKSESRVRFDWRFDEPKKYQEMVAGYYRMISGVDLVVGRIRDALKKKGLADNTVIIFTADNGYFLGERGFADKWYIYEHSIRVPLIVFDPRAAASEGGQVLDSVALNVDLAPTHAGTGRRGDSEGGAGPSLVPFLNGETPADWRTDFFYEHLFDRHNIPKSEGVRTERYTYVRWFEQKPVVEELYDHVADFDQVKNLIADPAFAAVRDELRKRTTELRDRYGGPIARIRPTRRSDWLQWARWESNPLPRCYEHPARPLSFRPGTQISLSLRRELESHSFTGSHCTASMIT